MYRFTVENPRRGPQLSIHAADQFHISLTFVDAAPSCSPSSNEEPLSSSPVSLQIGSVRLFRNIAYKGQFLVPFLPTKHLLIVFPNSVSPDVRTSLAPQALTKMSCFLSYLTAASAVAFTVDAVDLCVTSGAALVTISCETTEQTLDVLSASEHCEAQTDNMRMSAVYIRCYPVEVGVPPQLGSSDSRTRRAVGTGDSKAADGERLAALLRNHYYNIPVCLICADRLELNLTGLPEEQPLCACGDSRCHCFSTTSCVICSSLFDSHRSDKPDSHVLACEACGQASDPWVCLICGYVGCSRYQAMHAKDHYVSQRHFFSLNVTTQQVWDYESDNFVHRVVLQPEGNGNMRRVQYESRENPYASGELEEDELDYSGVDAGLAKKSVNAKYDLKLSGSHAQYATILKNELDSMRQLRFAQRADQFASALTTVVSGAGSEGAAPSEPPAPGDTSTYGTVDAQLAIALRAYRHQSSAVVSSHLSLRHTQYELAKRQEETICLERDIAEQEQAIREAIQHNIATMVELDSAIREQRDLITDLELNSRVSTDLCSRLQPGDGLARVVTVDGAAAQSKGNRKNSERLQSNRKRQ